ncbi:MAG: hypothetical protein R2769_11430 [Saprospiraceae bacterium]
MTPDNIGSRDRIAVMLFQKLNCSTKALNDIINSSRQRNYVDKVMDAVRSKAVQNVKFFGTDRDGAVEFNANLMVKMWVASVIEIDKKGVER